MASARSPSVAGTGAQRFRICGSEEESSDSDHFFHFRSISDPIANSGPRRGRRDHWLYDCLRHCTRLVPDPEMCEIAVVTAAGHKFGGSNLSEEAARLLA